MKKINKGFTIIEVLVSIFILTTVIAVPLSLTSRILIENNLTEDVVIARFLSQEAIELVRQKRDNNFLNGNFGWLQGLEACRSTEKTNRYCELVSEAASKVTAASKATPEATYGALIIPKKGTLSKSGTISKDNSSDKCIGNSKEGVGRHKVYLALESEEDDSFYVDVYVCVQWTELKASLNSSNTSNKSTSPEAIGNNEILTTSIIERERIIVVKERIFEWVKRG